MNIPRFAAAVCVSLAGLIVPSMLLAQTTITPITGGPVPRNATMSIRMTPLPDTAPSIGFVRLGASGQPPLCTTSVQPVVPATLGTSDISFTVPADLAAGQSQLCVVPASGPPLPVPSAGRPFEVANAGTVTLSALEPAVVYPAGDPKTYKLFAQGANFSPVAAENVLFVRGRRILPDCAANCTTSYLTFTVPQKPAATDPPGNIVGSAAATLYLVGGGHAEPKTVAFAAASSDETRLYAAAATIVIVLGVVALIGAGLRASGGTVTSQGIVAALLLADDGQSYSLSKFQFLLWTFVAVGGYIFLAFAWSLVQGRLDLPPVPEGLPGIIGISALTAITAVAASEARGNKGGNQKPSFGDLLMMGGRVLVERLQFFIWTIVSVLTFTVAVLMTDPGVVSTLPRVPEGLLFLMGISAAGYLGGKFVRRPAPSFGVPVAVMQGNELVITLEGRHLDAHGRIGIDRTFLPVTGATTNPDDATVAVTGTDPELEAPEAGLFKKLTLTVSKPRPEWKTGTHRLDLVNRDGQSIFGMFDPKTSARAFF